VDVVDEEIGTGGESIEDRLSARGGDVEGNAALVGVEVEEEPTLVGMCDIPDEWAARAGPISASRWLDLDHVGAEIREELRPVRCAHEAPELENPESR